MTTPEFDHITFHAIFQDKYDAATFANDPFFNGENEHQAKIPMQVTYSPQAKVWVVSFSVITTEKETDRLTDIVEGMTSRYGGQVQGLPQPEPAEPAAEQHSEIAQS